MAYFTYEGRKWYNIIRVNLSEKCKKGSGGMRLYIIRHGDPDYEADTITEDGHKEAQALAERLAHECITRIYSSPLGRAIATMKYTADLLGLPYNIEHWTKELWPELALKGTPWGDIMAINIPGEHIRIEGEYPTYENWHLSSVLKEYEVRGVYEELKKNSDRFIARHGYEREGGRYRCVNPNEEKIAVFCHAGFGLTWLAHLLEIPVTLMWSGFWLPTTSVTTLLFDQRSEEWAVPRCLGVGDVSHLYKAGLPVKPRGIVTNYY
jgi:broad specificity phosphatase PhoE